ncbi:MAG: hypothetical protein QHH24_07590 [Candidatus Bathyarchaeota archaeon]|nr:hypothetical protein [Candidatus Bathyarchaeota archaeon]
MKKIKALALLSGGLDSALAVKLMLDQGINVEAVNFVSPFCRCGRGGCGAAEVAKRLKIPLKVVSLGEEYLKIVRKPKHGYGKNMNPCIDCRILTLKKAKRYAAKSGAAFIFTGEVLNQRPMSQHLAALNTIEKEAGLEGKLLKPLSAKLLPATEAEKKGWVDREKLLDISGRSRKRQLELARILDVTGFACPAGGCLLTCGEFAAKLKDLFRHKKRVSLRDVELLKVGRHFRFGDNKIIVGRNKAENEILLRLRMRGDYAFEAQGCGSPITLLQGRKTKAAIEKAAELTARYCDSKQGTVSVRFGRKVTNKAVAVLPLTDEEIDKLRI